MALTSRMVFGWTNLVLVSGIALAIWVLGTLLFTRNSVRRLFDLSPQARFTVEPATADLLASLATSERSESGERLELHTIFRPLVRPGRGQVTQETKLAYDTGVRLQQLTKDLLRQYDYLGGEAVVVQHHDPRYDIEAIREVVKAVKALGDQVYGSVVVKLGKRSKVLSLRDDLAVFETSLDQNPDGSPSRRVQFRRMRDFKGEEAVSTAIKRLLVEGTPKLYVDVGSATGANLIDPFAGSHSDCLNALRDDGFEIVGFDLRKDRAVPGDADVVALFEAKRVTGAEADALLAFCRQGGRVLVTAPWFEVPASWNQPLDALGERFGFALGTDLVAHLIRDPNRPEDASQWTGGRQARVIVPKLNGIHPITAPLTRANRTPSLADCREVRRRDSSPEGIRFDPTLVLTGPMAWVEQRTVPSGAGDPLPDYYPPPGGGRSIFGSRGVGGIADVDASASAGDGASGDGRSGALVVMAGRAFDNRAFQINGDFALNVFNWLAERDALLSIRGRTYVSRRIDLTPQQADRVYWLLVVGVPGLLFVLGLLVVWRRSRH